jgi:glycine cleavage system T protein (aminomethyltransferase)
MPVEYSGIVSEHLATRTAAGLFDVSHMGEIELRGAQALDLAQFVTCNDAAKLVEGQAQYSGLMTSAGTFVDDLLVHKISGEHYFLCVNASNQDQDFDYIRSLARGFSARVENAGERYSQLAIQGPKALGILQRFTRAPIAALKYYHFLFGEVDGVSALIARTGYTGEDGFELFIAADDAEGLWTKLSAEGERVGLRPAGLGARDVLRLEAGMPLYGHELDEQITPLQAGLRWAVKFGKPEFIGKAALSAQDEDGGYERVAGLVMDGKAPARAGYAVFHRGERAGEIRSGSPGPSVGGKNIATALLRPAAAADGERIEVEIRGQRHPATIVPLPFYKRPKPV